MKRKTFIGMAAGFVLFWGAASQAATFNVTSFADDGTPGTLRYLLNNAGLQDGDAINLPAGTFFLNGAVDITKNVGLQGAGAGLTVIDGNGSDRIFNISSPSVSLYGMTLQHGKSAANGGAILYQGSGQLMIWSCALTGNQASSGGAVYFEGNFFEIYNTSVTDNSAATEGGGLAFRLNNGTVKITNTTLGLNNAATKGGGVSLFGLGNVTLLNDTISGNAAGSGAGLSNSGPSVNLGSGAYSGGANVSIKNTIVSGNAGGNCAGGYITSAGNNLEDNHSCGFSAAGDVHDQDPSLGPLQNNGGSSDTFALLPNSLAVDAGDPASCPPTDQRHFVRPADGNGDGVATCDIGAFELNAVVSDSGSSGPSSEPIPDQGTSAPSQDVSIQPARAPICGNGKKEGIEQCDDANRVNGDGCSATCRFEITKKSDPQVKPKKWYERLKFWK